MPPRAGSRWCATSTRRSSRIGESGFEELGGAAFFTARDRDGFEIWTSDGTEAGTRRVTDSLRYPSYLTALGGGLLFADAACGNDSELWTSDGTAEGTRRVQDIAPRDLGSYPRSFVRLGSRVVFTADDTFTGRELWSGRAR
jgi:ELWxxDGT repeat protein